MRSGDRRSNSPGGAWTNSVSIQPRLLRIPEAAAYLGATNWFVEELVRANIIPFLTLGKYRVIDVLDLDAWIEQEKKAQFARSSTQGAGAA
jgi:excisionase family DNA binding protein